MRRWVQVSGSDLSRLGWLVALSCAATLCGGCATLMGALSLGQERTEGRTVCDPNDPKVLDRWGELSGSFLLRSIADGDGSGSGVVQLGIPSAVAAGFNNIFIADSTRSEVLKLDRNSQTVRDRIPVAGLSVRTGLFVDQALSLYLSVPAAAEVRRYDVDGRLLQIFSAPVLSDPSGIAVDDRTGRVFVGDALSARVVVFDPAGLVVQVIGAELSSPIGFQSVRDVALAPDQLFVVDGLARRVHLLSGSGQFRYSFGEAELGAPEHAVVDGDNRVFVSDQVDQTIKVYRGGELTATVGAQGDPGRIHFINIADLWYSEGLLYVADAGSVSIKIFQVNEPCL